LWDGRPSRPSPEITEDEEWVREAFKHIGPTAAIPQACQDYLKEYNNDETQQAGETGN
jgi:hypothetical protein